MELAEEEKQVIREGRENVGRRASKRIKMSRTEDSVSMIKEN